MNEYIVHTLKEDVLSNYGSVYIPKIKLGFVIFSSDLQLEDVMKIEGVYKVREGMVGSF